MTLCNTLQTSRTFAFQNVSKKLIYSTVNIDVIVKKGHILEYYLNIIINNSRKWYIGVRGAQAMHYGLKWISKRHLV